MNAILLVVIIFVAGMFVIEMLADLILEKNNDTTLHVCHICLYRDCNLSNRACCTNCVDL